MELNDVFKANNYAGRKKVLDRFPLSKEDKDNVNKSIEKLANTNGGCSDGAFTYKSRKVVWEINKITEDIGYILEWLVVVPFYSVGAWDSYDNQLTKACGIAASSTIAEALINSYNEKYYSIYLEECEGNFNVKIPNLQIEIETNGSFIDLYIKILLSQFPELTIPSHEEIISALAQKGIVQYSYEDYMNLRVNQSYGCLTLKN